MFNKRFLIAYLGNNSHIDISCMQAISVDISPPTNSHSLFVVVFLMRNFARLLDLSILFKTKQERVTTVTRIV